MLRLVCAGAIILFIFLNSPVQTDTNARDQAARWIAQAKDEAGKAAASPALLQAIAAHALPQNPAAQKEAPKAASR